MDIQVQMCERAVELLLLSEDAPALLLDIGCGSGLSGSVLEDEGHTWIGIDISSAMLGNYFFSLFLDLLIQLHNITFYIYIYNRCCSREGNRWRFNFGRHGSRHAI